MTDAPGVFVTDPNDDDDAAGPLAVLSGRLAPGTDMPHEREHASVDKLFRVIEGAMRVRIGDQTIDVAEGGAASVPAGTPHAYGNPFDQPVAFVTIMADDVSAWLPVS